MKKISISIPKPCHENWDAMTPESKGRFCSSCQKTVVDFSAMSDRQLVDFFKKPATATCGRFMPDQLDRMIQPPSKPLPWLRYIFTIAIPAFLVSCRSNGQQNLQGKILKTEHHITGDSVALPVKEYRTVGMVMAQPADTVKGRFRKDKSSRKISARRCTIQPIKNDEGFSQPPSIYHPIENRIDTNISVENLNGQFLSGMVGGLIVTKVSRYKRKALVPLIPVQPSQKPFTFYTYPNPITASGFLTIQSKNIEEGQYYVNVISSSGQVVQREMITMESKISKATIQLQEVAAGIYFIQLTNTKDGSHFTEKIVVQ